MGADIGGGGGGGGSGQNPLSPPGSVLVLGVGNILLADEGVGVRAVDAFRCRYVVPAEVEILDGGTAGMGLIDLIAGRKHLIIVDAVNAGGAPGSIIRLAGADIVPFLRQRLSPHQLGLLDVLAYLQLMETAPESVTIIGITPDDMSLSLDLSPSLQAALTGIADRIADELTGLGVPLVRAGEA
ncbi:maturation element for hydrogenase 2 [Candidatus Defluviicoccus seviourii]|uniref:Maturation element for hydrogenase 2 n=2 Tax=root TaxID=1 RepID=A0A564WCU1_9PROT|nr:maturation element for hydrogenase 2 [uncultured Defluviicoccus sp.]VUX45353.1 maturation element for hydrogenase 2 [Candidatus Defluviicoccus seviourii]